MNAPTLVLASGNTITVKWDSITSDAHIGYRDITKYQLYYALSGYTNWTLLSDDLVNQYSQTNPASATDGFLWTKTYNYKVRAVNVVGPGSDSTTLAVATPTIPATITTLQCTSRSIS